MLSQSVKIGVLVCMLSTVLCAQMPLQGLTMGDAAPALSKLEWLKGGPVDIKANVGKQLYLVEFWATWCGPCKVSIPTLTRLQQKYAGKITIIGITAPDPRNSRAKVDQFLKEQGDAMDYVVAFDKDNATSIAYSMDRKPGIPHCYIVDKNGVIAWEGSPLDPTLDGTISRVLNGSWDVAVQKQATEKLAALMPHLQLGNWTKVRDGLLDLLKLDPASEVAVFNLVPMFVTEFNDPEGLRAWAAAHIQAHSDNRDVQLIMAKALSTPSDVAARHPDLALKAARRAYELSTNDAMKLDASTTYALVLYQIGAIDKAIEIQSAAVKIAPEGDRKDIQGVVDYLSMCKKLRDELEG